MSDRNYSASFNQNKGAPSFNYVWDGAALITGAGGAITTGAWTPAGQATGGGGGGGTADFTATNIILTTGVNASVSGNGLLATTNALLTTSNALVTSGNVYAAPSSVTNSLGFTGAFGVSAAREVDSLFGYCSGNAQYLRMYDGTGTNGTLVGVIAVSAQNNFSTDFGAKGARVTAGIYVAFSSSPSSAVATGPDGIITIVWK